MAAPNLAAPAFIEGKQLVGSLTTTLTTAILSGITDKVLKVNSIRITNTSGSDTAVTVSVYAGSGTAQPLVGGITVGSGQTLVILDRGEFIYLPEGYVLQGGDTGASSGVSITYEEIG